MPNGQNGNGGHCHNDKLSFELTINNIPIIIDPGTFVYTPFPKNRNQYRSTSYHNTVCIKKSEQNRFNNNLFSLSYDVNNITNKIKQFDKDFRYIGTTTDIKEKEMIMFMKGNLKLKNKLYQSVTK